MTEQISTGKTGEQIAAQLLKDKGYEIIETNKYFGKSEIDIIAKIGNEYVFVEVKTRKSDFFGFPEESVNDKKIEMMAKAAEIFTEQNNINTEVRFDIISIVINKSKTNITHIEDAFIP
ncbi:MAG: YraN family protein [Bacteroidia bacterium]|nr:YraN family protein [Bacteroidia bacterium]